MEKILQEKLDVCLYWFQFLNECTITKDYGVITIPNKFHESHVNRIKNTIIEYQNDINKYVCIPNCEELVNNAITMISDYQNQLDFEYSKWHIYNTIHNKNIRTIIYKYIWTSKYYFDPSEFRDIRTIKIDGLINYLKS